MPEYFTSILKANLNSETRTNQNIQLYIHKRPAFLGLFKNTFKDIDQEAHVEKVMKSLGWTGIRDRLTSMYIEHCLHGEFPQSFDVKEVAAIIDLEEELKPFTVAGHGRAFLLGLYLKLQEIQRQRDFPDSFHWTIGESIFKKLKMVKAKTVEIDWLVLYLKHLEIFLGDNQLDFFVKKNASYQETLAALNDEQRELMFRNFLAYGASVGDSEIFAAKRV